MTSTFLCYDIDDINLEERIGKGNFSVYRATAGGKIVAVKRVDCKKKNAIPPKVEVQSTLPPHPNVLSLLGIAHSKDGFFAYICMELADKSLPVSAHREKSSITPTEHQMGYTDSERNAPPPSAWTGPLRLEVRKYTTV